MSDFLRPTLPTIIPPGRGNVGMPQPLLHFGNVRLKCDHPGVHTKNVSVPVLPCYTTGTRVAAPSRRDGAGKRSGHGHFEWYCPPCRAGTPCAIAQGKESCYRRGAESLSSVLARIGGRPRELSEAILLRVAGHRLL